MGDNKFMLKERLSVAGKEWLLMVSYSADLQEDYWKSSFPSF